MISRIESTIYKMSISNLKNTKTQLAFTPSTFFVVDYIEYSYNFFKSFFYQIKNLLHKLFFCFSTKLEIENDLLLEETSFMCRQLDPRFMNLAQLLEGNMPISNIDIQLQLALLPVEDQQRIRSMFFQRLADEHIFFPQLQALDSLSNEDFTRTYLRDPHWFQVFKQSTINYINSWNIRD